jgi:hypothetical protein
VKLSRRVNNCGAETTVEDTIAAFGIRSPDAIDCIIESTASPVTLSAFALDIEIGVDGADGMDEPAAEPPPELPLLPPPPPQATSVSASAPANTKRCSAHPSERSVSIIDLY